MALFTQNSRITRPTTAGSSRTNDSSTRTTSPSTWSVWTSSSIGLMVTTSQQGSPAPSIYPFEAASNRTQMFAAPQVGLYTRASFGHALNRQLSKEVSISRAINRFPVPPLPWNGAGSSTLMDSDPWTLGGLYRFPLAPSTFNIYSRHANTLPQNILRRIFDFYVDNLRQDNDRSPFATPETLLHVCRNWKDSAECHQSIWAKVYITLIDEYDVGKWIPRIKRCLVRAKFLTDISIRDLRDLTSPRLLNTGADLEPYRQLKVQGLLAHLKDIALLTTELHSIPSRCRYKSFWLSMPPSFVEIIDQLDGDAGILASSLLCRIFSFDPEFLQALELENFGWITPTAGSFNHPQLPPIFQGLCNSLRILRLYNCFLPEIPNLSNPYELYLEHCFHWSSSRKVWEPVSQVNTWSGIDGIGAWSDLQKLTIGPLTTQMVPFYISSLHTFEIVAWWGHESTVLSYILNLTLENLHKLIISSPHRRFAHLNPHLLLPIQPEPTVDTIAAFFANAKRTKVVRAPKMVLIGILRFLSERSSSSSSTDRPKDLILCEQRQGLRILLTGHETKDELQDMALRYFNLSLLYWHPTSPKTRTSKRQVLRGTSLDLASMLVALWRP